MPGKKILVADDDAGIVDIMRIILENEGFEVIVTMTAKNIFELCTQKPDVIFLDIWMSGDEGNIICSKIKSDAELMHIPVIICSANNDTKQLAIESGADGFLVKPFEMADLLNFAHKYTM